MARIQYGGGVTAIEGSIGGWTFQNNNSGNIVRLRPSGKQARTSKQSISNQQLSQAINDWNNLPLVTKTLWNTFAATYTKENMWGETKTLTGFNWFFSINANRRILGLGILTTPPVYLVGALGPVYTLSFDASDITLNYISGLVDLSMCMFVYLTSPLTSSKAIYRPQMRFIKYFSPQPNSSQILTSDWETAFGISYPPTTSTGGFSLSMMLFPLRISSGIGVQGTLYINSYNAP